jgi:hypothetical protein
MNEGIRTVAVQFLFLGYLFRIFGITSFHCGEDEGCQPTPFHYIIPLCTKLRCTLQLRGQIHPPISTLPLYVLCGTCKNNHVVRKCLSEEVFDFVREDTCTVIAKVCACAKLLYVGACPKIGMKRNRGKTVPDQLICL